MFRHLPPEHPLRRQLADFRTGQPSGETDWLRVCLLIRRLRPLPALEPAPRAGGGD
ncbi:hypothetical protein GCM10019017_77650 [Streptomyces showdoensis]